MCRMNWFLQECKIQVPFNYSLVGLFDIGKIGNDTVCYDGNVRVASVEELATLQVTGKQ